MKTSIILLITVAMLLTACQKPNDKKPSGDAVAGHQTLSTSIHQSHNGQFISGSSALIDTAAANAGISSYLTSIDGATADQIKSFRIDASALRALLSNVNITELKISIAHTESIINSGAVNTYQALNASAIALIITGIDTDGDYVLVDNEYATNKTKSCPPNCLTLGNASNDFIEIP